MESIPDNSFLLNFIWWLGPIIASLIFFFTHLNIRIKLVLLAISYSWFYFVPFNLWVFDYHLLNLTNYPWLIAASSQVYLDKVAYAPTSVYFRLIPLLGFLIIDRKSLFSDTKKSMVILVFLLLVALNFSATILEKNLWLLVALSQINKLFTCKEKFKDDFYQVFWILSYASFFIALLQSHALAMSAGYIFVPTLEGSVLAIGRASGLWPSAVHLALASSVGLLLVSNSNRLSFFQITISLINLILSQSRIIVPCLFLILLLSKRENFLKIVISSCLIYSTIFFLSNIPAIRDIDKNLTFIEREQPYFEALGPKRILISINTRYINYFNFLLTGLEKTSLPHYLDTKLKSNTILEFFSFYKNKNSQGDLIRDSSISDRFGENYENFKSVIKQPISKILFGNMANLKPSDNSFLSLISYVGLLGFIIFCYLYLKTFQQYLSPLQIFLTAGVVFFISFLTNFLFLGPSTLATLLFLFYSLPKTSLSKKT